ncbi:hypothetical protein CEXT_463561 [Caerostris extrusa]|uniref:Uncharacterized protein n=1 Tax=Caerostris extrusa TaxID=172846 RepID=A0AAV4P9L9_CAEEX|nr:hypothetical protein CEXT_463561 [Caerostris extrusa]
MVAVSSSRPQTNLQQCVRLADRQISQIERHASFPKISNKYEGDAIGMGNDEMPDRSVFWCEKKKEKTSDGMQEFVFEDSGNANDSHHPLCIFR